MSKPCIPAGTSGWEPWGRSEDGVAWTLETVSNASRHLIGAATYAQAVTRLKQERSGGYLLAQP